MKALICGINGQDGAFLAKLLLEKGYQVWGTSRDTFSSNFGNLKTLRVYDKVKVISMAPNDFRSVYTAIEKSRPDEIYYLAGQSSVGLSFEQPAEALESISTGTLNLLEAIRLSSRPIKFYNAGSSECFGETPLNGADELTPFKPRSPYAVAKASAYWLVANYRDAYDIFACTGILFNHESPLRPRQFVTKKIVSAAHLIAAGEMSNLTLGRMDIQRDWGWAPEYVNAMWLMLQQEKPEDFVIATGSASTLQDFVKFTFEEYGLDWQDYVRSDESFFRPTDINLSVGNPGKARRRLKWESQSDLKSIVAMLVAEQKALS